MCLLVKNWFDCLASPELLVISENFFNSENEKSEFLSPLKYLCENQTEKIEALLKKYMSRLKTRRLGELFETFWIVAFELHPDYEIVLQNYQVQIEGKTFGEIDLIVENQMSRRFIHIELAAKFFMLIPGVEGLHAWVGPGLADRLDKKLNHLLHHQLTLPKNTFVSDLLQQQGIALSKSAAILRGRYFYPLLEHSYHEDKHVNYHANKGYWGRLAEWLNFLKCEEWQFSRLKKNEWLFSNVSVSETGAINRLLSTDYNYPVAFIATHPEAESVRGFVVPDDWYANAVIATHK